MSRIKSAAIVSFIACIALGGSLVVEVQHYQAVELQMEEKKRDLFFQLLNEARIAYEYWENWTKWREIEITPEAQDSFLEQHTELYELILNDYDLRTLKTVIIHGCTKTDTNVTLPNATDFYKRNHDGFAPYEVLVLPEYNGNKNFTETLQWLSTNNFTGVPFCLSVFEGGSDKWPEPNVKLSIAEIEQAMAVADVKMIRFAEMISFYLELSRMDPTEAFPLDEVRDILEFCRIQNLKVLWSEWKISDDVSPLLNSTIYGYEDIVTVVYQTNNEFDETFIGFLYATQFKHWGASVQSWWVDKETGEDRYDLPLETVMEYAKLARNMGSEIIQIEPYWYFFENGKPKEAMLTIWSGI
jgi:hypothetical protein